MTDTRVFGWQWSNDAGEQLASINVKAGFPSQDVVTVSYKWRNYGDDNWEAAEHQIALTRSPGTLGGSRVWFRCPHCWQRAVHLYITGRHLACRTCLNLAYPSQSDDVTGRCHRRIAKIERKLEHKGLHGKTIEKLCAQIETAESRLDAEISRHLIALLGHDLQG